MGILSRRRQHILVHDPGASRIAAMAKTIFITGVSSGLGYGLAKVYLEIGAKVYGCSRRAPDDLIAKGLHFQSVDLGVSAIEKAADLGALISPLDQIDCVILNAAKLGEIRDMADTPLEDLRETMEVNVWANKWILDQLFLRRSHSSGRSSQSRQALRSPVVAAGMDTVYQKLRSTCSSSFMLGSAQTLTLLRSLPDSSIAQCKTI